MPEYRYLIGDLNPASGTGIRDELPFSNVKFSHVLNAPGGFSASLPLRLPGPTRTAYADQHLRLPGTSGSSASTPDSAAVSLLGDLTIIFEMAADVWSTGSQQGGAAKYSAAGNQRSWRLYIETTGSLTYQSSTDGTNGAGFITSALGSGPVAGLDGQYFLGKLTHDVDNGSGQNVVRWYVSTDGGASWTLLKTDTFAGVHSRFDNGQPIVLGAAVSDGGPWLAGKLRRFELRNGIDGSLVATFDTRTAHAPWFPGDTQQPDGLGNTWTLNGNAAIVNTPVTTTSPSKVSRTNLDPGRTAIHIERDGNIIWSGILWTGRAGSQANKLDIGGEGWWSYFRRKRRIRTTKTYVGQDQLTIVQDLLNYAQAQQGGNLGIVVGSEISGVNRERTYWHYERKPIGEAIEQLAAVDDGFDFAIDVAYDGTGAIIKTFRLHYPRRGRVTDVVWELGSNLEDLTQAVDATTTANLIDALGAGEGNDRLIATAADTSQIGAYPLFEDTVSYTDVTIPATLQAHAALDLQQRARPVMTLLTLLARPSAPDTTLGSFIVGDSLTVRGSDGWIEVDERMRIQAYEVSVDENGKETVAVAFAQEDASG